MLDAKVKRILVVEDNPADAELIELMLQQTAGEGIAIEHASTLTEAAQRLNHNGIDVVLLDLRLPDGEGIESVRALQRIGRNIAIVVLTGMNDEQLALACVSEGAQDYISKQELRPEALWRAVRYAVARVGEAKASRRADELHARLAAIVEASGDAIISCTVGGTLSSWNSGAERVFGCARNNAVGRPAAEALIGIQNAETGESCDGMELFRRAHGDPVEQTVRLRSGGQETYLSVVSSALKDASGILSGWSVICRDVTAARRYDAELRKRNELLTERDQQLSALLTRLNEVREEESKRISREVHDQLGQLMTGFKMDLRWLSRRLDRLDLGADRGDSQYLGMMRARAKEAEALVDETISCVQRIAIELRPSALDALGLAAAIRDEVRRFGVRTGLETAVRVDAGLPELRAELVTGLFRILQELLTNVARHARASSVDVELRVRETSLILRVEDDGIGIDDDSALRASSLGLLGVRERARALGGIADVGRRGSTGTVATISVPLLS